VTLVRSTLYTLAYWPLTLLFAFVLAALSLLPSRRPLCAGARVYARLVLALMHWAAGIKVELSGLDHLPGGQAVFAAKHQSWGDPFPLYAHIRPLGFVAGEHLAKYPLVGRILIRLGGVILSSKGGEAARSRLQRSAEKLKREGSHVLIYPEGGIAAPGGKKTYHKGVWHLYDALQEPCVPVATNLGLAWSRRDFTKRAGRAAIHFQPPIEPGLDKDAFMARLEEAVEACTQELVEAGLR
jgi:1-acyl-sn-glycerol-3-phosphate acyltransferase